MSGLDELRAGRLGPGVLRCSTAYGVAQLRTAAAEAGWASAHLDAVDSMPALHEALARALDLPAHYGRNLDALHDALRDVPAPFLLVWDRWWPLAVAEPRRFGTAVDLLGEAITVLLRGDDDGRELGPGHVVAWLD